MAALSVGSGKTYSTIAAAITAAKDGDTINVDAGTYTNDWSLINKNITLQGVGGQVNIVSSGYISNGKAIFVTSGDITINNFTFSGAVVADNNGAGIKQESGNLVLNNCGFFNNQMGVLTGNRGTLTVDNCEFAYNGVTNGSGAIGHGLYANFIDTLTVNNSYFHDDSIGHEIKSRAKNTVIQNSRIYDLNATASLSIDLPNGGNATIQNNVIEQGPYSQNNKIINYGEEGNLNPGTNFVISGNTILNDRPNSPLAVWNATTTTTAQIINNYFYGLTAGQIVSGPNTQSGNQFLTTEPVLDMSHPWATMSNLSISLATDTGSSSTDNITTNPAVKGTGQANTLVTIEENGTTLATQTTDSTGAWSFTPTGLPDGKHTLNL